MATLEAPPDPTATHCPYCALQCGMHVAGTRRAPRIVGNSAFDVNKGGLCVKGWSAGATLAHPDRLLTPLVRNHDGRLAPAEWDAALDTIADRLRHIQSKYGRDAVGVLGGGSLTNEKAYLVGKFARVALGTANVDYNGRFCMSSAAAAANAALGLDRGLPFPLDDIAHASVILLAGANVVETMPPIMQYFERQQAAGGKLLVADPRRTATAEWATHHLALKPGSDLALANGLLHVLVRDNLIDHAYIRDRTEGFEEVRHLVATYWPERVERLTGIPEGVLVEAARLLGSSPRAMVLTARGPEQQSQGVNNVLGYINLALALGAVGKPYSGYGCLTGQGNGQGGREHGQKADQLPGYRRIDDPAARAHIAAIWRVAETTIPGPGKSAFEMLDSVGAENGIRALIVVGTNVAVSAPDALRVASRLEALDFLAVTDFFLSETAALADVVLPVAQWAEEDGTMTNLEGRVIRRRRVFEPPEGVRTDIEVLCGLTARLGDTRHFSYGGSHDVFEELRRASCGGPADYSGISYERIDAEGGVFWPAPSSVEGPVPSSVEGPAPSRVEGPAPSLVEGPAPRLFAERFPTANGRARFHAVAHQSPAEDRDAAYPLYLTTGRVLAHYQSGTQTRRTAALRDLMPEPIAEIHPRAARVAGVSDGEPVALTTRRGSATFIARVTRAIREDTVFVPFHWEAERSANRLTNAALDPTSRMPEFKVCAVKAACPPKPGRLPAGEGGACPPKPGRLPAGEGGETSS